MSSFSSFCDIYFENMESMVSSSLRKYQIQSSGPKEPDLLYRLLVSKMIGKLKAILFDPQFSQERWKTVEKEEDLVVDSERKDECCKNVLGIEGGGSRKSRVNSELQSLLKKRIAAKRRRMDNDQDKDEGEECSKMSRKIEPCKTPPSTRKITFVPSSVWPHGRD